MEKGQRGEGDEESYSCRNRFTSQKQKLNKNVSKICSIIQSLVLISPPHVRLLHAPSGVCNLFPFSCVSPAGTAQLCDIESDWWEKTSVRKSRKKPSCGLTWSCVEAQALGLCMSCVPSVSVQATYLIGLVLTLTADWLRTLTTNLSGHYGLISTWLWLNLAAITRPPLLFLFGYCGAAHLVRTLPCSHSWLPFFPREACSCLLANISSHVKQVVIFALVSISC